MDIETIRFFYQKGRYRFTAHVQLRLRERGIRESDIENVLLTGNIIEEDSYALPLPKVLILGGSINGKPLHVLVSVGNNYINIVTAYFPDSKLWKSSFSKRKKV